MNIAHQLLPQFHDYVDRVNRVLDKTWLPANSVVADWCLRTPEELENFRADRQPMWFERITLDHLHTWPQYATITRVSFRNAMSVLFDAVIDVETSTGVVCTGSVIHDNVSDRLVFWIPELCTQLVE